MAVNLDWPPDVVDRLTEEARRRGIPPDAYVLETVLDPPWMSETRRRRAAAGTPIFEIQKRVKPDSAGWTSRDYINYVRR